jgi:hypothetical protein
MKNLFVITEEEKNRILSLHESATKNQYLISEQSLSNIPVNNIQTVVIGKTSGGNTHTLIDGTTYNNIRLGFDRGDNQLNSSGTWYVQNEKYDNEFYGGNWTFDNESKKYTFNSYDGQLRKSGDFVQWGAFDDLIRYVVSKFSNSQSMNDNSFALALLKFAKDKNISIDSNSLLAKRNKQSLKYDVAYNDTNANNTGEVQAMPEPDLQAGVLKNAQACGWGDDVEGYKNSGWKCPKPGSPDSSKSTVKQPPKYYQQITDLQTKVGVGNTGTLDQATLKAIMDKLSQ